MNGAGDSSRQCSRQSAAYSDGGISCIPSPFFLSRRKDSSLTKKDMQTAVRARSVSNEN